MALLGRQPSGAYFFRACRTSRRMASDRLGKSGCSRRQSSTAARSSGVAIAQASGANVTSRSLHGLIRSRTVSLRRRCASGCLLRQRSLAVQATEAPLPLDPRLVSSGEQCAHPEIRAHHGASSVRSYLLAGRLPSHDLGFLPSTLRKSGELFLSPRSKTQARFPEERKPQPPHLLPQQTRACRYQSRVW